MLQRMPRHMAWRNPWLISFRQCSRRFSKATVRSLGESDSSMTGARTDLPERDDSFITVDDFARLARVSRRTIDRYRQRRATGFPTEYDMSRGKVPRPRFKLADVLAWMETRALWQ